MISGKKINLRFVKEADLEKILEYLEDVSDRGMVNIGMMHEVKTRKQYLENGLWGEENGRLLIVDKENQIVGGLGYWKTNNAPVMKIMEIGYAIHTSENRGKGYMSEAVSLFVAYLYETRALDRIQAMTLVENIGSQKILESNGFTFEEIL